MTDYVVLKEISQVEDLMEIVADTPKDETVLVFAVCATIPARDRGHAIKLYAVGDDNVEEGAYVAVPSSSWKIHRVKTVVQLTMGES